MRWDDLTASGRPAGAIDARAVRTRTSDTPESGGVAFRLRSGKRVPARFP
ncbi:hypothetical protein SUDANB6_05721 [Streptomyces sp. enrichment culture]